MFLGEAKHSLDTKGRVILPSEFRDQLADGAVVSKGLDGCLWIYPRKDFETMAAELYEKAKRGTRERHAARALFGGAKEVVPDKQGRIPIPQALREYALLDRDVFIVGQFTHLEIWDAPRWREQMDQGAAAIRAGEGLDDFM